MPVLMTNLPDPVKLVRDMRSPKKDFSLPLHLKIYGMLLSRRFEPLFYENDLTGFQICDKVGSDSDIQLVPNEERTREALESLLALSPRVMGSGGDQAVLYLFNPDGEPRYEPFSRPDEPLSHVELRSPDDWIAGRSTARLYALRTGICTSEMFKDAIKAKDLVPFRINGKCGNSEYSQFRAFRLEEIHALKHLS